MSITLATAALIGAIASAAGGVIGTGATMLYNKREAEKNRSFQAEQAQKEMNFQKEMRDTNLISSVNQANELGISPSLVLGNSSNSVGGAMGTGSQASANAQNIMSNSANMLMEYVKQDRSLDAMERLQDERLEAEKEIAQMKIANSVNAYKGRNYKKGEIDNLYDDIEKVKF